MSSLDQALPQLRKLLPLDDDSLRQILEYAQSLSAVEAADHLKNLLGDSPQAFEFISSFNARRPASSVVTAQAASASSDTAAASLGNDEKYPSVPKSTPRRKKGQNIKKLPPVRQVEGHGNVSGFYLKKDEGDYIPQQQKHRKDALQSASFALNEDSNPSSQASSRPISRQPTPNPPETSTPNSAKLPPSAAGRLISDTKPQSKPKSKAAKVTIAGGTPMHGASTALSDLDYAIRELEIQTNPTLTPSAEQNARRKCNCMATRHEILQAAPNCLNCGKIICVKEGLGPCTFCGKALLSAAEVESMIRVLRDERGKEKMSLNNAAHKRADVSTTPRPFSSREDEDGSETEKLAAAMQHRDRLLAFQAQNARRTKVKDEAADFETPTAGLNAWASPAERAMQLKKQQKVLREQEWNARPEWERKKMVASIDLVGGKVVRRMAKLERPVSPEAESDDQVPLKPQEPGERSFSTNPLLGGLIRPIAKIDEKGKGKRTQNPKTAGWRRVQDSQEDNEVWILDGGLRGDDAQKVAADEPACG